MPEGQGSRDSNVTSAPPEVKSWDRGVSRDSAQNDYVSARAKELNGRGAEDIRVNQQQVNARGERVGINRPDLQYTLDGMRYYEEFETPGSDRGARHVDRLYRNDPCGVAGFIEFP